MEDMKLGEFEKIPTPEPDVVEEAVIVSVKDGIVEEFVKNTSKWDNPKGRAISITMELKHKGMMIRADQIFSYLVKVKGGTKKKVYGERSNLGKFEIKYGSLPTVGQKVKVMSNDERFFKLLFK